MNCAKERSVLMLPWLGHGHISPFLGLAEALSKRNLTIYLCSTPINLNSIKTKLTQDQEVKIKLVEIHLPTLPNLPPQYHTTNGLPPHLMPTLKKAFDMSKPTFSNILNDLKPSILIYDFLQPWAHEVASSCNIPSVLFLPTAAASFCYLHNLGKNPNFNNPNFKNLFPTIYVRDYEHEIVMRIIKASVDEKSDPDRVNECIEGSNDIILIKTFREIEGKYIDHLSTLVGKKMVPVGPLVQEKIVKKEREEDSDIIEWLNKKEKGSTVYVSFGSESFLSKEEIEEMGHGLELSKVNFIWVIRFPVGETIRIEEALPKGFFERVGERGNVVEGWAPQERILRHENVGGFVSHCGWSSVMEGMKFGVPIIAMPIHLDQPFNARLVEELGVGEEVVRGGDGRLKREEVARVIRKVVVEKRGEGIRRKVKEMREILGKKGEEEIDWVVEELEKLCKKNDHMY